MIVFVSGRSGSSLNGIAVSSPFKCRTNKSDVSSILVGNPHKRMASFGEICSVVPYPSTCPKATC
jgi:hypothetical protein